MIRTCSYGENNGRDGYAAPGSLGPETRRGGVSLEVYEFPGGPPFKSEEFVAAPGKVFPELTITLEPGCDVTGVILDAAGRPRAKATVRMHAVFSDSSEDRFTCMTDQDGRFEKKHRLRAAPVTLKVSVRGVEGSWTSSLLEPPPGETLDLGEIVLP